MIRTAAVNALTTNFMPLIRTRLTRSSLSVTAPCRPRKTPRREGKMSDYLSFTLSWWLPFLTLIGVGYLAIRH